MEKEIIKNVIKCKKCGDVIESKTRHDFNGANVIAAKLMVDTIICVEWVIYKTGELIDVELPKEDEVLEHSTFENGDIYESKAFHYLESYRKDGSIIRMFTNKKDKAFISKIYPDGGKVVSQYIDGIQSGYALINKKVIPIYTVLMDNLTLIKTLQIEEFDH